MVLQSSDKHIKEKPIKDKGTNKLENTKRTAFQMVFTIGKMKWAHGNITRRNGIEEAESEIGFGIQFGDFVIWVGRKVSVSN